jgi:hypothetical protein
MNNFSNKNQKDKEQFFIFVKASFHFKYPLQCLQSNCLGLYADIDSFIVHIKKNHKDVRVNDDFLGENFNNNNDEDPLPII